MNARYETLLNSRGIRVEVRGLSEALRNLDMAGDNAADMRELMHSTGSIVARRAAQLVPVQSGRLQRSIKAGRGKTKAVIRAGSPARAPYAGIVEYPRSHYYMTNALRQTSPQVLTHVSNGIAELLKKNNLI